MVKVKTREQKYINCAKCGCPLAVADDYYEGDRAWHIADEWWCDECAEDEFKEEVTEDDSL